MAQSESTCQAMHYHSEKSIADLNEDGKINIKDIGITATHFGEEDW